MRVVGWILKIYCNLVETGETKDNWENFKTFQDKVLEEINKGVKNECANVMDVVKK